MRMFIDDVEIDYGSMGLASDDRYESVLWAVVNGNPRLGGDVIITDDKREIPHHELVRADYQASKTDWRSRFHNN